MAIKYEKAKGDFTSFGGLKLFEQVFHSSNLKDRLKDYMPTGQRITVHKSYNKFIAMVYGMIVGNDCIEDMDHTTKDPIFSALCQSKTYTSQNYGKFLRSFSEGQVQQLTRELKRYSLKLRQSAFPKDRDFILDIDSTLHEQYGKKMEGVEFCYAQYDALSSLHVYDQYGFQYYIDVRPGATHTAKGASQVIQDVFKGVPKKLTRFLRADAGYCNHGVMKACLNSRASFVIAATENIYEPLLEKQNIGWWKWKKAKHTKFRDGRLVETVSLPYYIKGERRPLRIVVMRAKKKQPGLFNEIYDYRAFITDMSKGELSDEEVIDFYKGRGNAENYIKENKNAFDMHHFPCQKLLANKVWALISAFAYTSMRIMSPVLNNKTLHFAKRIRFRMIYLGAHVVKKSRYWVIRLNNYHYEEVRRFQCRLTYLLTPG